MLVALGPVGVKLDVRQVDWQPLHRFDGCERRLDVAGHPQIAPVHVEGMADAALVQAACEIEQDLARRQPIVDVLFIQIELALVEFES